MPTYSQRTGASWWLRQAARPNPFRTHALTLLRAGYTAMAGNGDDYRWRLGDREFASTDEAIADLRSVRIGDFHLQSASHHTPARSL